MKNFLKFKNHQGVEYEIVFRKPHKAHGNCDGICFVGEKDKSKIYINPHRSNQVQLNTIIHEVAHAYFPEKSEAEILAFGNTLSRVLYNNLGWRREDS